MAALSGEKTLAELAAEFGVHPTMISNWKQELVKRAGELFAARQQGAGGRGCAGVAAGSLVAVRRLRIFGQRDKLKADRSKGA